MVPPSARDRFDAARLINIANGLTAARVLLVPVFAYLLISGRGKAALLVFGVCGLTDALDGLLARWLKQRTLVGALLDPIADKLLMATAFIVLAYVHIVPLRLVPKRTTQFSIVQPYMEEAERFADFGAVPRPASFA